MVNDIPKVFCWTVDLHNEVNKYLKKPIVSYEEAYKIYSDENIGACFDCGNESPLVESNATRSQRPEASNIDSSIRPNPKTILVKIPTPLPFSLIKRT